MEKNTKICVEWCACLPPTLKLVCFCKSPCYLQVVLKICVLLAVNYVSIADSSQTTMFEMGGKVVGKTHAMWMFTNFHFWACYSNFWPRHPPKQGQKLRFKFGFPFGKPAAEFRFPRLFPGFLPEDPSLILSIYLKIPRFPVGNPAKKIWVSVTIFGCPGHPETQ